MISYSHLHIIPTSLYEYGINVYIEVNTTPHNKAISLERNMAEKCAWHLYKLSKEVRGASIGDTIGSKFSTANNLYTRVSSISGYNNSSSVDELFLANISTL